MAFANVRGRLHFRRPGFTWSEAHYRAADTVNEALMIRVNEMADKRRICLVNAADLHSYGAAAVQERRVSLNRRKNDGSGNINDRADIGNGVVRVTLLAGTHTRDLALHGCPDADTRFSQLSGQDVTVASAQVTAFLDYLTLPANGWQMRFETKRAGDPANPTIKNITVDDDGVKFEIVGVAPAVNDKFKVSGCKGWMASQFDGDWKAAAVAGGIVTCLTTRRIDERFTYVKASGAIRVVDAGFYSYAGYTGWDPLSVVSGTVKTKKSKKK